MPVEFGVKEVTILDIDQGLDAGRPIWQAPQRPLGEEGAPAMRFGDEALLGLFPSIHSIVFIQKFKRLQTNEPTTKR